MLYLFPGELESQEMSDMFQTLQIWRQNFGGVWGERVYQISSNYLEIFSPGLVILTHVCLFVCVNKFLQAHVYFYLMQHSLFHI